MKIDEEEVYAEAIISTKREYPIWEEKVLLRQDDDVISFIKIENNPE